MKDEFGDRLRAAKRERDNVKPDFREIYKFLFNGRETEWDDGRRPMNYVPEEIFDSAAAELNVDFATDLCTYLTPDVAPWVAMEAGVAIPEDFEAQALEMIDAYEGGIMKAIRSSNYYHVCHEIMQEAGLGTVCAHVDREALSAPIHVEPVPLSEIAFCRGPKGIEDRFRMRREYARDIPILFPDGEFDQELRQKIEKGTGTCAVVWGWWRDYSDPVAPFWVHEARVDGKKVYRIENLGRDGACPLIIGRFGPEPGMAYGRGPSWRLLPDIRTLDALQQMLLESIDRFTDPAWAYYHDGMLDLSQGIESGKAYPSASPDVRNGIVDLTPSGSPDYGYFSKDQLEARLRRGFFQDAPFQEGKTPPTATQWLDEAQRIHKRLGKPAGSLWREFCVGLIRRVEKLEVDAGFLPAQVIVNDQIVTMRPISPLSKAQGREDAMTARSILDTAQQSLGPEQAGLVIDGPTTIRNLQKVYGDKIVAVRSEEQIAEIMKMMQPNA